MTGPACILGTASALPGAARSTREVAGLLTTPRDPALCEQRTGIRSRHWVPPGTPVVPLAAQALRAALADARLDVRDLRRLIVTSSNGGDMMFPSTASILAAEVGADETCDAFDVANACMGFLTALDLAARSVATGLGPVAIVSAELNSRGIHPGDHKPFLVFGDAAAAAIVGAPREGDRSCPRLLASFLGNDASSPDDVYGDTPQLTGEPAYAIFAKSNAESTLVAMRALQAGLEGLLARSEIGLDQVEWVIPHQGNGVMLDAIVAALGLAPERVVRVVDEAGAITSACVPLALDRLRKSGKLRAGDRVLLAGLGGGISYGAALCQVGGR